MALVKEHKSEIISEFRVHESDTGSPEVQVAILTERIVTLTEPATLAEHRKMGVQMLDRLMQHLPRLAMTGQHTGIALREVRVALNLLDLLAYSPRILGVPRVLLNQVVEGVGGYFKACLKAGERLPAPSGLLMTLDRTRRALNGQGLQGEDETRLQLLHALSGFRLALLPGCVTGGMR